MPGHPAAHAQPLPDPVVELAQVVDLEPGQDDVRLPADAPGASAAIASRASSSRLSARAWLTWP